jgi:hypothetical protein
VNAAPARTRYALTVLEDLFPGCTVAPASRERAVRGRTFALAPSGRHPRLLVPTRPRDAAGTALRGYGGRLTRGAQRGYALAGRALAASGPVPLRTRISVIPGENPYTGIDDHLSVALGSQVSVAVHLTPERANRKPVLQALAAGHDRPLAFAKVGVDPLTSRLVRQEGDALASLEAQALTHLVVPGVAHRGMFGQRPVLALEPLPTWLPGCSPRLADVAAASREIADLAPAVTMPLGDSRYWRDVQARAAGLPPGPRAAGLQRCVERISTLLGSAEVTFTASHGDWTPWNMWLTDHGLLVWDWERFERETPAGLDLLHFRLNDRVVRGEWSRAEAGHRLTGEARELLADSAGVAPLHSVVLYLVHLGLRYEADGQAAAGAALGSLETWLLPALEAGLDRVSA